MSTEMTRRPAYEYSSGPMAKGYMVGPWQQPPSYGYSPAPSVLSQQSNLHAVEITQPSALPSKVHVSHPHANEHLTLTIVMMVLCFLHGNLPAFVFLIPALCFSRIASSRNDSGDYEGARKFGKASLCCNVLVFIFYILLILAGVTVIVVYFTVGFSSLVGTTESIIAGGLTTFASDSIPVPTIPPMSFSNI